MTNKFAFWKGKKLSEKHKKNLSKHLIGNKHRLGKKLSEEHKKDISKSLVGNKRAFGKRWTVPSRRNYNKNYLLYIRNSSGMIGWKNAVFSRDNFTCQVCGQYGGELNVHHIKSFRDYPELRQDINNGMTLCKNCHKKCHKKLNENSV